MKKFCLLIIQEVREVDIRWFTDGIWNRHGITIDPEYLVIKFLAFVFLGLRNKFNISQAKRVLQGTTLPVIVRTS